jgi:hypothetical protein
MVAVNFIDGGKFEYPEKTTDHWQEEFEDTKGVIRISKPVAEQTQWPTEKGQKDKPQSTKHYTEN